MAGMNPQTLQGWGINTGRDMVPGATGAPGQVPGQPGVGSATPMHSFMPPGFNPEKDTMKGWGVMPGNPYKQTHAQGLDYNQMAGKLSNNKSWDPQDYFANANMNPRYAAFGGMPQGGMSSMMAERSHGGPGNSAQGLGAYAQSNPAFGQAVGNMFNGLTMGGGASPQGGKGASGQNLRGVGNALGAMGGKGG